MELGLAFQTNVATFIMKDINSVSTKIALVIFGCIGSLPVLIMPILVGAMIDHLGLTGKEAGLVVSMEMMALGLSVFGMSLVLHRWDRRSLLLSGLALFIFGQLASAAADGFMQLAAFRVIAGLGGGILVSTMKAVIASIREPVRILSIYGMCLLIASAVSFSLMPLVISPWGIAGAYVTLGLLAFPSMLFISLIPRYAEAGQVSQMVGLKRKRMLILMALVALLVYYLGFSPVWNYMERLGVNSGIDIGVVGMILSGVAMAGLVGGAFAASLSTRYGSAKPLVVGFMCILGGLLLLASGKGFWTYSGGAVIFNFGNFFTAPYLLGMLARLDQQGRLIVVGFLMQNIGMATGAALAAMMLTGSNYIVTVWIGLVAFVFSFAIFISVILRLDRNFVIPLVGLVLSLVPVGGMGNDGIEPMRETAALVPKSAFVTVFNTDVFTLYSKTVGDTFEISIAYPRSYQSSDRSYPVVYLLDPSLFFATATQIAHTLTKDPATGVDEVLLVGIGYPLSEGNWYEEMSRRRIRDLSPPGFSLERDRAHGAGVETGGARRFLTFIEKELDPAIRKSFRAEGNTAGIMGTSRGGVFALYAFAQRSRLFDRYWMGSTGFTDENDPVLKKFEAALKDGPAQETWLFLSIGELELRNLEQMGTAYQHKFISTSYNKLERLLQESLPPTVHAVTHVFPGESHATVPASALTRAFIVLYGAQR